MAKSYGQIQEAARAYKEAFDITIPLWLARGQLEEDELWDALIQAVGHQDSTYGAMKDLLPKVTAATDPGLDY